MSSLAHKLSLIVQAAFAEQGLSSHFGAVRVSDRPDLAQFQCNGAMAAAKEACENPRKIAESLAVKLEERTEFSKVEVAGPGFINLNVTDDYLRQHIRNIFDDDCLGVSKAEEGQTVLLDYGGPNIAKPMHVGHLRASIIGDALRRLYVYAGYKTFGDVHMGDWGLPMGQVISELEIRHPDWPYFDKGFEGAYPENSPVSLEDLEEIYPAASAACREDFERMEKARQATVDLQNGRSGYRALWKHFIDVSVQAMKGNFDALGVHFDLWKGEADVHDLIAPMVEDLKHKNLAFQSEGALVVDVTDPSDNKEMPPLILYKTDGAVMYGTTDLATIVDRVKMYNPVKIVYVTDHRQSLHFEQVFRAARKAGIADESLKLVHAGFGTMNGPDGKPFKTRAGGVMKLEDLIRMAVEKAHVRLEEADLAQDMSDAERSDVGYKVALAALKFADLQNSRISDYIFDLDRMVSFEGKTGPYLLYQCVRINSLLNKVSDLNLDKWPDVLTVEETDRSLYLLLSEYPDHFDAALQNHTPHVLCDYAYRLAQAFSSFYGQCHILSEQEDVVRQSRLILCSLTRRILLQILGLMGIETPARM